MGKISACGAYPHKLKASKSQSIVGRRVFQISVWLVTDAIRESGLEPQGTPQMRSRPASNKVSLHLSLAVSRRPIAWYSCGSYWHITQTSSPVHFHQP
eukprot:g17900.t1